MCTHTGFHGGAGHGAGCGCSCNHQGVFLSKKKKVEALKKHLSLLEERAEDLREYIKEIEKDA